MATEVVGQHTQIAPKTVEIQLTPEQVVVKERIKASLAETHFFTDLNTQLQEKLATAFIGVGEAILANYHGDATPIPRYVPGLKPNEKTLEESAKAVLTDFRHNNPHPTVSPKNNAAGTALISALFNNLCGMKLHKVSTLKDMRSEILRKQQTRTRMLPSKGRSTRSGNAAESIQITYDGSRHR